MDLTARGEAFGGGALALLDDAAVLARVARHDRDALEELHYRHGAGVRRFLVTLCGDPHLAEDVLQETLIAVWHGAASFAGRSSVRTWLFGIARRQAHTLLRRVRHDVERVDALEDTPAATDDPEALAISSSTRDAIVGAFSGLVSGQRAVVLLVLVEGLSYEVAADVLGIPVGTVKSRLSLARRALRVALGPAGYGPE